MLLFQGRTRVRKNSGVRNSTDQMFADFNTMVEELGGIETMKNDFVSNVSHEIRNPLAVIKNYATMMRDMDMDKAQREECVRTIISASERLNALVTNILKLNKLESQTIVSQAVDYDLTRQLTDEILTLDDLFTEKNIDLGCDLGRPCDGARRPWHHHAHLEQYPRQRAQIHRIRRPCELHTALVRQYGVGGDQR